MPKPASYGDMRIGVNDAARLLGIRTSELKTALQKDMEIAPGIKPPSPLYVAGSGGLVFLAADVQRVAGYLKDKL